MNLRTIILALLFCFPQISWANNLQISNSQITNINSNTLEANIQLDISWENSWRDALNYDAAWVFIKFRPVGNMDAWQHATLNLTGHTVPPNAIIDTSSDGKGIFIYRNAIGSGTISFDDLALSWNFGNDGLSTTDNIEIKVFGIEMVFVDQGSFYVGDGQTDNAQLYGNFEEGNTGNPFQIVSENAITLGGGSAGSLGNNDRVNQFESSNPCGGCLAGSGDDFDDVSTQTLPADFPKGFNAFYCMKYELTQQQYVDMLNCLTPTQQTTYLTQTNTFYYNGTLAANRYDISESGGIYSTAEPHTPMVFFDWIKTAAYADWSALRPMTELEFEKACRGFTYPVVNEFAWGNANVDLSDNLVLSNVGQADENIISGYDANGINGNLWVETAGQNMQTVSRVGVFAAHPSNSGRVSSGSTIWGIMEMSGHAWERAVSVGHSEGRKYTGLHGDGDLSVSGYANVANWPGTHGGSTVESNIGVGYRGGALAYPSPNKETNARVSSRRLASGYWNTVINDDGARLVRTVN